MKQVLFALAFAGFMGSLASALVFMLKRDQPVSYPHLTLPTIPLV